MPYIIGIDQLNQSQNPYIQDLKKRGFRIETAIDNKENPYHHLDLDFERSDKWRIQGELTTINTTGTDNEQITDQKEQQNARRQLLKKITKNDEEKAKDISRAYDQVVSGGLAMFIFRANPNLPGLSIQTHAVNLYEQNNEIHLDASIGEFYANYNRTEKTHDGQIPGNITFHYIFNSEAKEYQITHIEVDTPVLYKIFMTADHFSTVEEINDPQYVQFYKNLDLLQSDTNIINIKNKLNQDIEKRFTAVDAQRRVKNRINLAVNFFNRYASANFSSYESMLEAFREAVPALKGFSAEEQKIIEDLEEKATQAFTYKTIRELAVYGKSQLHKHPENAESAYNQINELKTNADKFFYGFNQIGPKIENHQTLKSLSIKLNKGLELTLPLKEISNRLYDKIDHDFADKNQNKNIKEYIDRIIDFIDQHEYTEPEEFEHLMESIIEYRPDFKSLTEDQINTVKELEFKATEIFIQKITQDLLKHADEIKKEDPLKAIRINTSAKNILNASDKIYRARFNQKDTPEELFKKLEDELLFAKKELNDPRDKFSHKLLIGIKNFLFALTVVGAILIARKVYLYNAGKASSPFLFAQTTSSKIAEKGAKAVEELKNTALSLFKKPGGGSQG